jgi:hypothetical protein
MIAFGYHHKVMHALHIKSEAMNQFRAVCRFAWVFYFTLPLFLLAAINQYLRLKFELKKAQQIGVFVSLLYFVFNLTETGPMIHYNEDAFWKFRNFFNSSLLSPQEKMVLRELNLHKTQAIVTLPLIHGGSEMYDRNGSSNAMAPAMLYSFHSGLPILGIMASRGSRNETEDLIQLYNSYKHEKTLASKLNTDDFFVIRSLDPLFPDEERLKPYATYFFKTDSLDFGFISKHNLLKPKKQSSAIRLLDNDTSLLPKYQINYIASAKRKPFVTANMADYETIFTLDSNTISSGRFIISLHYYFEPLSFRNLALDLIVTESQNGKKIWKELLPIRKLSGFYKNYAVFENFVELQKNASYEFILKGPEPCDYHISNFLLRPAERDVYKIEATGDTLYNNYLP